MIGGIAGVGAAGTAVRASARRLSVCLVSLHVLGSAQSTARPTLVGYDDVRGGNRDSIGTAGRDESNAGAAGRGQGAALFPYSSMNQTAAGWVVLPSSPGARAKLFQSAHPRMRRETALEKCNKIPPTETTLGTYSVQ